MFGFKKKRRGYFDEVNKANKKRNCIAVPEVKLKSKKKIRIKPPTSQLEKIKKNRIMTFKVARAIIIIAILFFVTITGINNYMEKKSYIEAYEVYIDGEYIASVRSIEEFESCMFRVQNELADKLDDEVKLYENPEYKPVKVKEEVITPKSEIEKVLREKVEIFVGAFSIEADEEVLGLLKSKEEAEWVLDQLKKKYYTADPDVRITFAKDVEIDKKHVKVGLIDNKYEVLESLQKLEDEVQYYTVKQNDTLWDIALDHEIPVEEVVKMNPGISENIQPGQKIALSVPKPVLPVEIREKVKYVEDIPYPIKEVEDNNLFQGRRRIVEKGVNGEKLVTAELIKINGIETGKDILKEVILYDPRPQTEKVGTKELPPKFGTGVFGRPLYGVITSRFGYRWGRMHNGLDVAGNIGDNIYAADGGKVIYADWLGNYGYLVKIHHDNEYVTYYGHCSKILVKVGQRVAKGEVIAKVGNTGRSTGPHLHFEVRKNGVPQNPLKYVSY